MFNHVTNADNLTRCVPKPQFNSLSVDFKTSSVVFKHSWSVSLKKKRHEVRLSKQFQSQSLCPSCCYLGYDLIKQSSVTWSVIELTSGKQSFANTLRSDVFPHWLSPTTTILHFMSCMCSILQEIIYIDSFINPKKDFVRERDSFITYSYLALLFFYGSINHQTFWHWPCDTKLDPCWHTGAVVL